MSAMLPPSLDPADATLRGRQWQRFLQGPDRELRDELYIPALSRATRYDRCCAYFSSSVLSAAARGFGGLIARLIALGDAAPRPAIRLIVNEELAEADVRALTERGDTTGLAESLLARFSDPSDALVKERLAMLGWLVREGFLSVRVGVMRQGRGILHAKYGIVTDDAGDAIIFAGSGNESAQGLFGNYEQLEVTASWDDTARHAYYTEQFAMLWDNRHPDVYTVTLPDALHLRLIQFAPREPPVREPTRQIERERAAMRWRFIAESPYLANGAATCDATAFVEMWPHQRRVVDEVTASWPDGRLLCDEVGMGKTIEAMLILRRLMAGRGVRRVLILLPAGLLRQWQTELREKGGLSVPRLEGTSLLVWPDDRSEPVADLATALTHDALIVSRETVRSAANAAILYSATPWDLVILDEAHAARRSSQREGEYNSGTLLLDLLRNLQLRKQTRGLLLLSATPMQTEPWEPWDLLAVLGEGGRWLSEFAHVRDFYDVIPAVECGTCTPESAHGPATTIATDPAFPRAPHLDENREAAIAHLLRFAPPSERPVVARWMREGSPLARRMHRNTRDTLREYHRLGLLAAPPPRRIVEDVRFDFGSQAERDTYLAVGTYIEKRFKELESEKPGKGFVMTVYRRRASSSSYALRRSMERRRDGLQRVIDRHAYDADLESTDIDMRDVDDYVADVGPVSAAFPTDPLVAKAEIHEVEGLLGRLDALGATDTKRDCFFEQLRRLTEDGRHVLVFTEYGDTMAYLRDELRPHFGAALACYSGEGGQMWNGEVWRTVTKDDITRALHAGNIHVLLCTDAASEGLNLQAAAALINYDLPWNPSKIEQRIGRIDRIGQERADVLIVNLFLRDSVDDRVYTVLRQRCGLFVRFVGPMQPVLARARRILATPTADDHGEVGAANTLEHLANEKQQDTLLQETYIASLALPAPAPIPAITREDIVRAISLLEVETDITVALDTDTAEITLDGIEPYRFALTAASLENNRAVHPLSPLDERMRTIADHVGNGGARLPLIVASFQHGGFRSTVVHWVLDGAWQVVCDIGTLESLLSAWNGTYPAPALWRDALDRAREQARTTVEYMESEATARLTRNIEQQHEAARGRLIAELGRYLVCASADWTDLNVVWHEQMNRDNLSAIRLHRCYERLGGWYSGWATQIEDLRQFERDITESQRKARLTGRELEAALDDPRWRAV